MRRYLITDRWVLTSVMLMPKTMITKNNRIILVLSCSTLKLGASDSINNTVNQTATMAMQDAIKPLIMALILIGRAMKPRVAPTICMVLIKNRLLYMASLMVLSIEKTTSMVNRIAANKKI